MSASDGRMSLRTQCVVAKAVGLLIGVLGFALMPLFMPDADPMLRWGVLLWYPTLGAVIVAADTLYLAGASPVPLPWWLRAALVGAWLNLVATLFAYGQLEAFLAAVFGPGSAVASPFWFVAEGALVGAAIGYMVRRFGSEDRDIGDG